jgi:predicted RNase H-like HicB family nuclease
LSVISYLLTVIRMLKTVTRYLLSVIRKPTTDNKTIADQIPNAFKENIMLKKFTLEYWIDDGWYVGRLREVPGVFSQGENFEELKENIRDAYQMIMQDVDIPSHPESRTMEIEVVV